MGTLVSALSVAAAAPRQRAPRDILAVGMILAAWAGWAAVLALRYRAFDFWDWDLAIFAQGLWSLAHGHPYSSIMGLHVLGNHANLVAYLLAPLYRVIPHPYLLLLLKVSCCTLAAMPLYLLARDACGRGLARCLVAAFLLYAPLTQAIFYEFDYESLAPLLLLWLWWALAHDRRRLFLGVMAPTLLLKENLPLLVAMIGLAGLLRGRRRLFWAGVMLASLAWFAIAVFVIIPSVRGGVASAYWSHYAGLGDSPGAVLRTLILRPWTLAGALATPENAHWLWQLLAPVGLLAVFGMDRLLLGAPLFLQHMLSRAPTEHTIYFSYGALPSVFIFLGVIASLQRLRPLGDRLRALPALLGVLLLACAGWTQWTWGAIPPLVREARQRLIRDELDGYRASLLRRIPPSVPVIASFAFLPPLTRRPHLYGFHNAYMNRAQMSSEKPYVMPQDVQDVLIDVNDPLMVGTLNSTPPLARNIAAFYHNHPWDVVKIVESLLLMRPGTPSGLRPFEASAGVGPMAADEAWQFEGGVRLVKPRLQPLAQAAIGSVVPVDLTWQLGHATERNFGVLVMWATPQGRLLARTFHPMAYRFYPTSLWTPGQLVRDHLFLLAPQHVAPGSYQLFAQVVDEASRQVMVLEGAALKDARVVWLGTIALHS